MNTFKMSPDTLFHLACDVIDSLEQILSTSLSLTENEIYAQLESNLGYSLTHIRDIFKLCTNISLAKYIIRRKYTNILLQMSVNDFEKLTMHAKILGIPKFKSKCLREFPFLVEAYSSKHMQPPIDKSLLRNLLDLQIVQRGEAYLMRALYKDIIKNRAPYEIKSNSENIIIQTSQDILIDLEKTYFTFRDKVFKITASQTIVQRKIEESCLSRLLDQQVYVSYNLDADANTTVRTLHQFLTGTATTANVFSLFLEWGYKQGWGTANLISSMSYNDAELQDVKFVNNPFLLFDNQNVILNLSFLIRTDTYNILYTQEIGGYKLPISYQTQLQSLFKNITINLFYRPPVDHYFRRSYFNYIFLASYKTEPPPSLPQKLRQFIHSLFRQLCRLVVLYKHTHRSISILRTFCLHYTLLSSYPFSLLSTNRFHGFFIQIILQARPYRI